MSTAIQDGNLSSASGFMRKVGEVRDQGQAVLDDLVAARAETLFRVEQSLSALNSKQQLASRVLSSDMACRFVMSDLLNIDQARTSATLRADAQAATCRENATSSKAEIRKLSFNSALSSVEQFGDMYRVHVLDDAKPTGVFELEFYEARDITLLAFDMVSMPSSPTIEVFGSADGVVLTPAKEVSVNGYRVNAWFAAQAIRYIQIRITPRMPDTLGGSSYTFGLTAVSAFSTTYYRYSEVVTLPVAIAPVSPKVRFRTEDPNLSYFLQFDGGSVYKVEPDQILSLPGVSEQSITCRIDPAWRLSQGDALSPVQLPATLYPSTLRVRDRDLNQSVRLAYGLDPALAGQNLSRECVAVHQGGLFLLPVDETRYLEQAGRSFEAVYVEGPPAVYAVLRVQLSSANRDQTPVFRGAWLEHLY